jgi:hypothetical protein
MVSVDGTDSEFQSWWYGMYNEVCVMNQGVFKQMDTLLLLDDDSRLGLLAMLMHFCSALTSIALGAMADSTMCACMQSRSDYSQSLLNVARVCLSIDLMRMEEGATRGSRDGT